MSERTINTQIKNKKKAKNSISMIMIENHKHDWAVTRKSQLQSEWKCARGKALYSKNYIREF